MLAFDTSAIIHGWDNYPIQLFPNLWIRIARKIKDGEITISSIALEEITHVSPECETWLKNETELVAVQINNTILRQSLFIKNLLGINNDRFGSGVGENDIFIIATAKILNATLISNEHQPTRPKDRKNYKIPTVCAMPEVQVECITFLDFLKTASRPFA